MDLMIVKDGQLTTEAVQMIVDLEKKAKEIKEAQDLLKAKLLAAMEENGVKKIESDELTITYVAPTDRETFDSKKLREDNPDLYDEYIKISKVKASVRVKVNG